jgi:hypothetical protein
MRRPSLMHTSVATNTASLYSVGDRSPIEYRDSRRLPVWLLACSKLRKPTKPDLGDENRDDGLVQCSDYDFSTWDVQRHGGMTCSQVFFELPR